MEGAKATTSSVNMLDTNWSHRLDLCKRSARVPPAAQVSDTQHSNSC